jgi:hypothetical protein
MFEGQKDGYTESITKAATSRPIISDAFNRLDSAVDNIEGMMETVIARISSVLTPPYPSALDSEKDISGDDSDVFTYLTKIAARLENLHRRLSGVNDRIQL